MMSSHLQLRMMITDSCSYSLFLRLCGIRLALKDLPYRKEMTPYCNNTNSSYHSTNLYYDSLSYCSQIVYCSFDSDHLQGWGHSQSGSDMYYSSTKQAPQRSLQCLQKPNIAIISFIFYLVRVVGKLVSECRFQGVKPLLREGGCCLLHLYYSRILYLILLLFKHVKIPASSF